MTVASGPEYVRDLTTTNVRVLKTEDNGLTIEADEGGQVTLYGDKLVTGWRGLFASPATGRPFRPSVRRARAGPCR